MVEMALFEGLLDSAIGFAAVLLAMSLLAAAVAVIDRLLGPAKRFSAAPKPTGPAAVELTAQARLTLTGQNTAALNDGTAKTYAVIPNGGQVTVSAPGMASLYILFDRIYGQWTLKACGREFILGKNGYLHEFVDLEALTGGTVEEAVLEFNRAGDCQLSQIYVFGPGRVPDWVQRWEPPCEQADLMLFSTHIDDEQLYFAGVLPYYAGELRYQVQVAYFTDPFGTHDRPHEQLNGLWTVGVRHYPVWNRFEDAYSETTEGAYARQARNGYTKDDIVTAQVRLLRRFKPLVAVGHDINGEYGHGQHKINSETLREALPLAANPAYDPESVSLYGVWDTPKAYIHLWKENRIVMNWDRPLARFGGKTAFQMTQEGFWCHESQRRIPLFSNWIYGERGEVSMASHIKQYSPCRYGLFRTLVGPDFLGGEMFENLSAREERSLKEAAGNGAAEG